MSHGPANPENSTVARSVLIVDDDVMMASLFTVALASPDRATTVTPTWGAAQAHLARSTPSLIVMDLVLPDADGRNAIAWLRANQSTARIPIVVVSGALGDGPRAQCLALGANAYITKPVDPAAFAKVVNGLQDAAPVSPLAEPSSADVLVTARNPVLLAEDDPVVATLVIERLKRAGLEVVHCVNGGDAAERVKSRAFACAILDIKLPGLDGFAVLSAIRSDGKAHRTPVAMLTGMGQEKDVTRSFELGADDYIVKPFSPRELSARILRLIERSEERR